MSHIGTYFYSEIPIWFTNYLPTKPFVAYYLCILRTLYLFKAKVGDNPFGAFGGTEAIGFQLEIAFWVEESAVAIHFVALIKVDQVALRALEIALANLLL